MVNSSYIDVAKPVPQLCALEDPPVLWVTTKPSCTTNSAMHSTNKMQTSAEDICAIACTMLQPRCVLHLRLEESVNAYAMPMMIRVKRRDTRPETKILTKSTRTRFDSHTSKYPRLCVGLNAK